MTGSFRMVTMDQKVAYTRERMDCSFLRRVCMQQGKERCASERGERGCGGGGRVGV